jgi:uncharacterized protein
MKAMKDAEMSLGDATQVDWTAIGSELDKEGYAIVPKILRADEIRALGAYVRNPEARKEARSLDELSLGRGALWRLPTPLPGPLLAMAKHFFPPLARIGERWSALSANSPSSASGPASDQLASGEDISVDAVVTSLREGEYQALHQHTGTGQGFPLQLAVLLSDPETEFAGGEFVMTEQRPRMQSRPMVLPLKLGDVAVIAVGRRPFKGAKGYYGVNTKHAISRIRSGERLGVEVIFHIGQMGLSNV